MKVSLNQKQYVRQFELNRIETDFHRHPAMELIICREGNLSISCHERDFNDWEVILIGANVPHKVTTVKEGIFELYMIDAIYINEQYLLQDLGITTNEIHSISPNTANQLLTSLSSESYVPAYSEPILQSLNIIFESSFEMPTSRASIAQRVYLSPSRLSHVFKKEVGISISTCIAWHRMGMAFEFLTSANPHLGETSMKSGFYDQATFSRSFKKFFGMSPSKVYNNSTIVQNLESS